MTFLTKFDRWDPFEELSTLRNRMDRLWSRMTTEEEPTLATWAPTSDILETKDEIVIKAELPGVYTTAVGYAGGLTPNPSYREVCTGMTGHNEVVLVVYDPAQRSYEQLLATFWESHDPTQGMRQGNDIGTQYRSGIYTFDAEQAAQAQASRAAYQQALAAAGYPDITTEIVPAPPFYYAEDYHQQYLAKNPGGYCGLGGTGVSCPVGLATATG